MNSPYQGISASKVAEAARLNGVAAAVGGLPLLDQWITFPKSSTTVPQSGSYWVDGVDVEHLCAAAGVGLGFAGAAIIAEVAPNVLATVGGSNGLRSPGGARVAKPRSSAAPACPTR